MSKKVIIPNTHSASPFKDYLVVRQMGWSPTSDSETYVDASITNIGSGAYPGDGYRIKTWGHAGDADGDEWRVVADMHSVAVLVLQPDWTVFKGFVELDEDRALFRYEEWSLYYNPERAQELRESEGVETAIDKWGYS